MILTEVLQTGRRVSFGLHGVLKVGRESSSISAFSASFENLAAPETLSLHDWQGGTSRGRQGHFPKVPAPPYYSAPRLFGPNFGGQMALRVQSCLDFGEGVQSPDPIAFCPQHAPGQAPL